ncbi:MAG: TonB-dependent receptor [Rhodothermales bacterium]
MNRIPWTWRARWASLVLLIGGISATTSFAQTTSVAGTVHDAETGETLPFASVAVKGTTVGAATNVDGFFVLLSVPRDSLTLLVRYIGYQPAEVPIDTRTLDGPLRIELDVVNSELGEVEVTAESYEMIQAAEDVSQVRVSPKDLAVLPNAGEVDIFRSLQLLPGISGTNEGASGLYVRGGTPDQNLVLLDGMTVYHVDHFYGFFSAFNADAIKDVQVYKGAFPAQYGGRTSSVVDLTGRTGGLKPRIGVGVNLLSANAAVEMPLGDRAAVVVTARRSYTDILQTGLYNSIYDTVTGGEEDTGGPAGGRGPLSQGNTFQPAFYFYDLNAKVTYRPSDRDVLALSVYNGADNLDKSRDVLGAGGLGAPENVTSDLNDLTDWGNIGVSGKWSRQWHPRFYSNALAAYSQYYSDYDRLFELERRDAETDTVSFATRTRSDERNRVGDFTLRLDNTWQVSARRTLDFGMQYTASDVTYDFVRDDTLNVLARDQQAVQLAGYLQQTRRIGSRITWQSGVRIAYFEGTDETYVEPRTSLTLNVTDRLKLKGAYGRFNQVVSRIVNENITEGARDFWLLADGTDVGVSSATHYVAGISYETPNWLFDVEAYQKDQTGLTEFSLRYQSRLRETSASELFFTGDGVARGIEVLLQRKTGRHTGWLSYTLADVEHTFPGLNAGEAFPALHDQSHELKLVHSYAINDQWRFSATWMFGSGTPYTAPSATYNLDLLDGSELTYVQVGEKNGERLPAYHRLDAGVHFLFPIGDASMMGDVGFSVFNLYNRSNVWYREYDFSTSPLTTTDVGYLGFTPNISFRVDL